MRPPLPYDNRKLDMQLNSILDHQTSLLPSELHLTLDCFDGTGGQCDQWKCIQKLSSECSPNYNIVRVLLLPVEINLHKVRRSL